METRIAIRYRIETSLVSMSLPSWYLRYQIDILMAILKAGRCPEFLALPT